MLGCATPVRAEAHSTQDSNLMGIAEILQLLDEEIDRLQRARALLGSVVSEPHPVSARQGFGRGEEVNMPATSASIQESPEAIRGIGRTISEHLSLPERNAVRRARSKAIPAHSALTGLVPRIPVAVSAESVRKLQTRELKPKPGSGGSDLPQT